MSTLLDEQEAVLLPEREEMNVWHFMPHGGVNVAVNVANVTDIQNIQATDVLGGHETAFASGFDSISITQL